MNKKRNMTSEDKKCLLENIVDFVDENKDKILLGIVIIGGLLKINRKLDLVEKDLTTLEKIYQRSFPLVRMPKVRK